jgi:hypothetical protein
VKSILGFKGARAYGVLGETQFSTQIFEMTLEEGQ